MLPCNQCKQEISLQIALLTQDFYSASLVFCSIDCKEEWLNQVLSPIEAVGIEPEASI